MTDDLRPPYRIAFDNARDPYAARNALGIMGTGAGINSVSPPLSVTGGNLTIDLSGYQPLDADLTAIAALTGTNTIYYRSGTNVWSPVNISTGLAFSGGNLTATGGGNVSSSGTPAAGQVAEWVTATTIAGVSTYAKLASPTFTGTPAAPTAAVGTSTTQIATTAFVRTARTDASAVPTGHVGEYLEAIITTGVMAAGAWVASGSIALPAGDWDVWGQFALQNMTAGGFFYVGLSETNPGPDLTWLTSSHAGGAGDGYGSVAMRQKNFSGASKTIYMISNAPGGYNFASSRICARRRS